MVELAKLSCQRVSRDDSPLSHNESDRYLAQVPGWQCDNHKTIFCDFKFDNYYQTIAFVNSLAWIAHQCDHHPDLDVGYNHCLVTYSTHAVNGLTTNDFICAARINALLVTTTNP